MPEHDLADIQGYIVRGYNRMHAARHFLLKVADAEAFRAALGQLVTGSDGAGRIQDAGDWGEPGPDHCLNVAFTHDGLAALGVADDQLAAFPKEFRDGAEKRAGAIWDVGESAPDHWVEGIRGVHCVLSLYARDAAERDGGGRELAARLAGAVESTEHVWDADRLPGDEARPVFHFGYRDGFSQPTVAGLPNSALEDPFPVSVDHVLLAHAAPQSRIANLGAANLAAMQTLPTPEIAYNGTLGAFRILRQDVRGFEEFLADAAAQTGRKKDWVAAKVCGRWRNGLPVLFNPDVPESERPEAQWNMFDYSADPEGERCPVGSHIRRGFPRTDLIAGGDQEGLQHRIIRRGMPYGPPFDPDAPDDGRERGLVGFFFGASLRDQFEFVMRNWMNAGSFNALGARARDVFIGANTPTTSGFTLRPGADSVQVGGFSRFVTTRGGAYCFVPGMTALRRLAAME